MKAPLIVYNHTEYKDLPSELYTKEKYRLQVELLKMQEWMIKEKKKIAIGLRVVMLLAKDLLLSDLFNT